MIGALRTDADGIFEVYNLNFPVEVGGFYSNIVDDYLLVEEGKSNSYKGSSDFCFAGFRADEDIRR